MSEHQHDWRYFGPNKTFRFCPICKAAEEFDRNIFAENNSKLMPFFKRNAEKSAWVRYASFLKWKEMLAKSEEESKRYEESVAEDKQASEVFAASLLRARGED
jgi:hypothetical protein